MHLEAAQHIPLPTYDVELVGLDSPALRAGQRVHETEVQ